MKTPELRILLLLVDAFERREAEEIHGRTFENVQDITNYLGCKQSDYILLPLDEFAEDFNDERINESLYWISFIHIEK